MSAFELVISALATLALFAYGLQSLSREIEETRGDSLKRLLSRVSESSVKDALVACLGMKTNARHAAIANAIFNGLSVLVILPLLAPVSEFFAATVTDPGKVVSWAHLSFNLMVSVGFAAMHPIERIVSRMGSSEVI